MAKAIIARGFASRSAAPIGTGCRMATAGQLLIVSVNTPNGEHTIRMLRKAHAGLDELHVVRQVEFAAHTGFQT